jgi:hypothetical protein
MAIWLYPHKKKPLSSSFMIGFPQTHHFPRRITPRFATQISQKSRAKRRLKNRSLAVAVLHVLGGTLVHLGQ